MGLYWGYIGVVLGLYGGYTRVICVRALAEPPDAFTVPFDQCMLGLVSKVHKEAREETRPDQDEMPKDFSVLPSLSCSRDHEPG